jgi:heme-degrading monooxygenase HmoA
MTTTPEPPHFAVIFTNRRASWGDETVDREYEAAAARMEELAATIPGYLGIDSTRAADGAGITVSYWADEAAIENWRRHPDHLEAQARGRRVWYEWYEVRVARVTRAYGGPK